MDEVTVLDGAIEGSMLPLGASDGRNDGDTEGVWLPVGLFEGM